MNGQSNGPALLQLMASPNWIERAFREALMEHPIGSILRQLFKVGRRSHEV
jgi:hypothetical protein